jgi:AbrB family looped-hinge helix DNA binding protein
METKIDALGRIVVPKALRDQHGLTAGTKLDISWYDGGLRLVLGGRTARIVETEDGPVIQSDTVVTDEMMYAAIDAGRK